MTTAESLHQRLPPPLQERVLALSSGPVEGAFVLVWMRTALRAFDNPALDVALFVGDALELPVFVYQGLSERYPFASDRHHSFILQGARDVHRQLRARGIGSALHVERPGHTGPHLRTLAAQAALVLTEDLPVPPLTQWTAALRDRCPTPLWVVDTACILPMRRSGRPARAFRFRKATEQARRERLQAGWQDRAVRRPGFVPPLPFDPVDLDQEDIATLVAACRIDHGVGPVPHTVGGTSAGMARWAAFRDGPGLRDYARARNAAQRDGVSRMSAYLHYGMVSPFALAADALDHGSPGAEKWLDEFLVWRELAHAWCAHTAELHRLAVLPDWARATLERHAGDPRPARFSWESLARAQTGDALWDLAQQSLLRHGELHNNLRMTWGKQLLQWSASPEQARALLVDLNHRFALDGRDPCSYGGLYWCLGLFDRPFTPAQPIFGQLRPRDTASHARRLPLAALRARVHRPLRSRPLRIAVVGAGMAGLSCARVLVDHGLDVEIFEKSRGPSGRMSTRRLEDAGVQVDHGAQYFTARSSDFRRHVESWEQDGVVAPWTTPVHTLRDGVLTAESPGPPRYVGTPRMSALGRHLARGLRVHLGTQVRALRPAPGGGWQLDHENTAAREVFDMVLLAVPAPQAAALLQAHPRLREVACSYEMVPCQAIMMKFAAPLGLHWEALRCTEGPLAWIARDSSKPGRPAGELWVAHSAPQHAAEHLEEPVEETRARLILAFQQATGYTQAPVWSAAHRWRYARPRLPSATSVESCVLEDGLGLCGDWLQGPRLEAAWSSGRALAGRVLGSPDLPAPPRQQRLL